MTDFKNLHERAHAAGIAAGNAAVPVPMVVGEAQSLLSDKIDRSKPTYYVADGVCGFAWVHIQGNTPFARWATKNGVARPGYPKGKDISCHEFGQSMQRKEAYARAYARVLNEAGIRAYAESRLD